MYGEGNAVATPRSSCCTRVSDGSLLGCRPSRRHDERGAALVEFALILPLLMSLVLGMVTGGAAYNTKLSMTSAVREGTRFGATLPNGTLDWANKVRSRVQELSGGDLAATNANAQVCVELVRKETSGETIVKASPPACSIPSTKSPKPDTPSSLTFPQCVVKVWSLRTGDKLQAMFFSIDLDLKANSVSLFEENTCSA